MFRIGEFSRIARVSGRLLRYYDELGLLSPQYIDRATGYRFYAASQLTQLNRILALKELGFTLDQIARLLEDRIEAAEIRGMLLLKKSQIERSLDEEAARLRHIESRLRQIDEQGSLSNYDIVIKAVEPQPFASLRRRFANMDAVVATLSELASVAIAAIPAGVRQSIIVVAYSDFDDDDLDLELGVSLTRPLRKKLSLPDGPPLRMTELPGVAKLATLARRGPATQSHLAFGALGHWMEAHRYNIGGPSREVFLEPPFARADSETVMEIQFPIVPAATGDVSPIRP